MSLDFEMIGTCPPPAPWANNSQTGSVGQLLLIGQQHQRHYHNEDEEGSRSRCCCWRCCNVAYTWFTSAVGVSFLLCLYLILGAVLFIILGNTSGFRSIGAADDSDDNQYLREQTTITVDRLWAITEDLNILYRENWTELARNEMKLYQERLVRTLRRQMTEERYSTKPTWTFSMSFLYSVTLVTTIGYGYYTPWTILGRCLTTAYSIFGVPLFLIYLSVTGERLAGLIVRLSGSCHREQRQQQQQQANYHRGNNHLQNDGTAAMLAGTSFGQLTTGSNGHAIHHYDETTTVDSVLNDENEDQRKCRSRNCGSWSLIGRQQVPVFICAGLLAVLVLVGVVMLSWLDPSLDYADSLHLLANLLLTLGFAGHMLPGLSLGQQQQQSVHSSATTAVLLLATATLIVIGMTLLSATFNVIAECNSSSSSSASPPINRTAHPHVTYRHVPSPSQQIA